MISFYIDFFRCSRVANSAVSGGISPKYKLIQAVMVVLVTCKDKNDSIKNEGATVITIFLSFLVYDNF